MHGKQIPLEVKGLILNLYDVRGPHHLTYTKTKYSKIFLTFALSFIDPRPKTAILHPDIACSSFIVAPDLPTSLPTKLACKYARQMFKLQEI